MFILRITLFYIFFLSPVSYAQESKDEELHLPLNFSSAEKLALDIFPGEVLRKKKQDEYKSVFFEFAIKQESGVVGQVELNAYTAELIEIELEEVPKGAKLPIPRLTQDDAREIALAYLEEKQKSKIKRSYSLQSVQLGVTNRHLAYQFEFKERLDIYQVSVNAYSGRVLSSRNER